MDRGEALAHYPEDSLDIGVSPFYDWTLLIHSDMENSLSLNFGTSQFLRMNMFYYDISTFFLEMIYFWCNALCGENRPDGLNNNP